MPREVPGEISMAPLRASASKCSSAALAERKPNSAAISARVGGKPVLSMAFLIRFRICSRRAVSLIIEACLAKWQIIKSLGLTGNLPEIAGFIASLYFYTALAQMQAEVACFPKQCFAGRQAKCRGKRLKALRILIKAGMIAGFPLPTLVLTPGWAIFNPSKRSLHASL